MSWDGGDGIRAVSDSRTVELKLNEKEMRVDGQAVVLDVAPAAVEGPLLRLLGPGHRGSVSPGNSGLRL